MQEFSSVTASSYDAESLAPLLNERAADGWEVVSIVSAGTNIVAYLSRHADASAPAESSEAPVEEIVVEEAVIEETTTPADDSAPLWGDTTASVPADEPATEEPAGWAAAPESTETVEEIDEESVEDLAAQVGGEEAAAAAAATTPFLGSTEPTAEPEPVAETPAAEPEPVAEPAPAAEPAVPAGWYADPSGRFELRYWDGAAWTEHVSRAGQQFTDPPVA